MASEEEFGSPNANDTVARWERIVDKAAHDQAEMVKRLEEEYARPLGSKRVPHQEEAMEYELLRQDPDHALRFFRDRRMTLEQAINWAHEMEKGRG